jgi:hypothetical protein
VTEFESQLVADAAVECPESMSDIWIVIAKRIGVAQLAVVLDEIGGEKVHVPKREEFFAALYRPHRDLLIHAMRHPASGDAGASLRAIARVFGLTETAVRKALRAARRTTVAAEL